MTKKKKIDRIETKVLTKKVKEAKAPLSKIIVKKQRDKEFEFLEHTADVKFRAYGKTLDVAFSNAAKATTQVMTDIKKIKPKIQREIFIRSKTKEALLYDFLEELIYLVDTEGFLLCKINSLTITKEKKDYILSAQIKGDNSKNYDVHTYIKAVTYNDMKIEEHKNKIILQVVHDI